MTRAVYYLPGFGGELGKGLGSAISDRGFDVLAERHVANSKN